MQDKLKAEEEGRYFKLLDLLIVAQHANDLENQDDDFNIELNTIDLNNLPCQHDYSKHQNQIQSEDAHMEAYNMTICDNEETQHKEMTFPNNSSNIEDHDQIQLGYINDLFHT